MDSSTNGSHSTPHHPFHPELLPQDHLERVWGWGLSSSSAGYVFRPSTPEQLRSIFHYANEYHHTIGFRGAGRSYGDAARNSEQIVVELTRMDRILEWNPETGIIRVEPGVTIERLWKYIIEDGWWPSVVSGTMFPTLGGCASMNIHGKNNFAVGPIGDHILSFVLMTPQGEMIRASREERPDIFHAAIGGFGMLGCFVELTLQTKKIYSGLLEVEPIAVESLAEMFRIFEERLEQSDYLVGWIDAFGKGKGLGRGEIHQANYLPDGLDQNPAQTLRVEHQQLPDTIFGLVPKSILWKFMRPFVNNIGWKFINYAKYRAARLMHRGATYRQSHAAFAFLLDYVPNWKKSYGRGGLIQYQSFVPKETAQEVFRRQLDLCQKMGLPSYLAVFKRHRPDPFIMTHALDGYSLALDFKITESNREDVWRLAHQMNNIVLEGGGRFYFAKDSTLRPTDAQAFLGDDVLRNFFELKKELDPNGILQTDLARRLFADYLA